VFAPKDKIKNVGSKYRRIDGKRTLIDEKGQDAFAIKKGQFQPIPFEWSELEKAKEIFDPKIFEFFPSKSGAAKQISKEANLLKMLPVKRMEEKNKRAREKVLNAKYGQKRATMDDVVKEAKKIGVDIPVNVNLGA